MQLESREAEFAREKAFLEDLLTDVQGADKRAQESQVTVQQELLVEAQRTRVNREFVRWPPEVRTDNTFCRKRSRSIKVS